EAGWDEPNLVMRPPAGHRFLGRPVCRAAGCVKTARSASGICRGCSGRLARYGLTVDDIGSLPAPRHGDPGQYVVQGCPREWKSGPRRLCTAHEHQRAKTLKLTLAEFLTHPAVGPLPPYGPCVAAACARSSRSPTCD